MSKSTFIRLSICGLIAGSLNGLLGTGGGMLLVPLLISYGNLPEDEIFPSSVCIMLPISIVSLIAYDFPEKAVLLKALPYVAGGILGGIIALSAGNKIPVKWLHRGFGLLILLGGIQKLC